MSSAKCAGVARVRERRAIARLRYQMPRYLERSHHMCHVAPLRGERKPI